MNVETVYKVLTASEFAALQAGVFRGSAADLADGFIHLSTATQLTETVARHFAGQRELTVVAFSVCGFGDALCWEVSRGGQLFPHLYGPLRREAVLASAPLRRGPEGAVQPPCSLPTTRRSALKE